MILSSERQVILELSHVILDHTHHGMRIYPTSMTAALILQHRAGLERSENLPPASLTLAILSSLRRADETAGMVEDTGITERLQGTLGER